MAPDAPRKGKQPAQSSAPVPDGDHRKRRRNRTTLSCLNCHASKRMCDRKRPACLRCTTLGLTGLCAYEVDDPSQRDTQQDEKILLRGRVAELESVIREMKNKPHPRWAPKTAAAKERANARPPLVRGQSSSSQSSDMPPSPSTATSSDSNADRTPPQTPPSVRIDMPAQSSLPTFLSIDTSTPLATPIPETSSAHNVCSPHALHSHVNPSPTSVPTLCIPDSSAYSSIPTTPWAENAPFAFDAAALSSAMSDATGFEDGIYGHILDQIMRTDERNAVAAHDRECSGAVRPCDCIGNAVAYNTVLELSVRLRKAAQTLGRLVEHRPGADCVLFSKIAELDTLASTALGNAAPPSERCEEQMVPYDNYMLSPKLYDSSPVSAHPSASGVPPESLFQPHNWGHRAVEEDSLMSWDASQYSEWPQTALM